MKTILYYQVKDFKKFVLENLEKRGYVLAAGCEPMIADMGTTFEPEKVVMEVLVEDRQELDSNQVVITAPTPAALPAPAPVEPNTATTPKKEKAHRTVTEKEAARRLEAGERMKALNASKAKQVVEQVVTEPEQPAVKLDLDHQHTITIYPVLTFSDPDDQNHKHYTRMCKTCGWSEGVECLTCKGRAEFQEKVRGSIEEIKKEKQEVVAPTAPTFQAKESAALTR